MTPRRRTALTAAVLLTGALLVGASLAQRGMGSTPGGGYGGRHGPGIMGGYGTHGYGMTGQGYGGQGIQSLDFDAARAMIANGSQGAAVDPATNTVSYSGSTVTLNVIAVQPDEPDTTFEIAGLVEPTVKLARGATVTLHLINMDYGADMPHGLVITRLPPPYPTMAMMGGDMMGGNMMAAGTTPGIPPLAARSQQDLQAADYAAATLQFRATTPGTYYYVCQVPGHARDGMYGKIIVE